jgi:hypothetical protein
VWKDVTEVKLRIVIEVCSTTYAWQALRPLIGEPWWIAGTDHV